MLKLTSAVKNAFNEPVPSIASLLESKEAREIVQTTLARVLTHLGLSETETKETVDFVIREGRRCSKNSDYELNVHNHLREQGVVSLIPGKLHDRSSLIFNQIRDYISAGASVVDIGCGDAGVAEAVSNSGNKVNLCDVYEHPRISSTGLPFSLFPQGNSLPFETNSFDVALVLTVFHHSDDPIALLAECARVLNPNGRLIIIESVYGVNPSESPDINPETAYFASLDSEAQRISNIFFDHFYNRVVHYSDDPTKKVNVPFNFNTPSDWNALFRREGFREAGTVHLGIDQPIVPEYHTLHIFDKIAT